MTLKHWTNLEKLLQKANWAVDSMSWLMNWPNCITASVRLTDPVPPPKTVILTFRALLKVAPFTAKRTFWIPKIKYRSFNTVSTSEERGGGVGRQWGIVQIVHNLFLHEEIRIICWLKCTHFPKIERCWKLRHSGDSFPENSFVRSENRREPGRGQIRFWWLTLGNS